MGAYILRKVKKRARFAVLPLSRKLEQNPDYTSVQETLRAEGEQNPD